MEIPGPQIPELESRCYQAARHAGVGDSTWDTMLGILVPLLNHSPETYAHSLRVGLYSTGLAAEEGLDASLALHGGCAHDIGKCKISVETLRAEHFTDDMRLAVREHPRLGQEMLAPTHLYASFIAGLHHQFQPDPYGIELEDVAPDGLSASVKASIYEVSRLVATCDFYDALTTRHNERYFVTDVTDSEELARVVAKYFGSLSRAVWLVKHDLIRG